jgi:hypothetical protein
MVVPMLQCQLLDVQYDYDASMIAGASTDMMLQYDCDDASSTLGAVRGARTPGIASTSMMPVPPVPIAGTPV